MLCVQARIDARRSALLRPPMNRESYNKIAPQWSIARKGFFGRERDYLDAVLKSVPEGATILDLGCGTGRPMAEYVVAMGRHIVGVDQSEALLDMARARLPQENWVLAAIETYGIQGDYAGAIIWDSLFHIRRSEHEPILKKVIQSLPVGGRLMVTVGGSEHPPFTDFMYGQRFFYDSHAPEQTERILRDLGCRLVITEYMNLPNGETDKGRYAIVAEKA